MANESQNKIPDNVVSLSRHEFVANIERKLAEARRLFSLGEYRGCDDLTVQVLAADPHNSKAKALQELASIKLSRRKLYKKMLDPATAPANPPAGRAPDLPKSHPPRRSISSLKSDLPSQPERRPTEQPQRRGDRRSIVPDAGSAPPEDSMRERTISAMVELLNGRAKPLEKLRSTLRSVPPRTELTAETEAQQLAEVDSASVQPGSFVKGLPEPAAVPRSTQPVKPKPIRNDFFSGSLDDLFGSTRTEQPPVSGSKAEQVTTAMPSAATPLEPVAPAPPSSTPPGSVVSAPLEPQRPVGLERPAPPSGAPRQPIVSSQPADPAPQVVHLPDVRLFHPLLSPRKLDYQEIVEEKLEQRSEEIKNSEIKSVSIAQIKKYLYQENYDLCGRELERIRTLFPQNPEIQAFVQNTSKRLTELQRIKAFEHRGKELMVSAVAFYQEGKLDEALIAAQEILRVNPDHIQAKEFVSFVQRRHGKDKEKKEVGVEKVRYCKTCGTTVDSVSQFCFRCGKRLT